MKGGIETKITFFQTQMLFLHIYDDFCCSCVTRFFFIMFEFVKIKIVHTRQGFFQK
jgi:hypothetical protein